MTQLLTLENFRQNEKLSNYADVESARTMSLSVVKELIERNPSLNSKLQVTGYHILLQEHS